MKSVKKTALSALLAALSVTVMYAGSMFGKIDIATAVISSVCVMICLGETGYLRAVGVYAVTTVLSFILVPAKTAVIMFAVLFGMYPVVKTFSESRLSKAWAYILKYIYLNISVIVLTIIASAFSAKIPWYAVCAVFVLSNLLLPVYDAALKIVISFWYAKIRPKSFFM